MRLVEDDLQPVEPVRQDRDEVRHIPVEALCVLRDTAHTGTGRTLPRRTGAVLLVQRLDPVLELVGELVTTTGDELDPVVRHGVVAGGEHHAEVGAQRAGEVRHRGGGQHTDAQDVHAARQTGHDSGLQELSGRAWVTAHHGCRPPASVEGARLSKHMRRSYRQTERELGRQIRIGDTAYTVRAEESSHWCPPKMLRNRTAKTKQAITSQND